MTEPTLPQRRLWFRYFPEGSIEFTIVTRLLIFLGLLASAAVGTERIRYYFMVATCGALWLDYMLTLWWLIQVQADLRDFAPGQGKSETTAPPRTTALFFCAIPSIIFFLIVAPWPTVLIGSFQTRELIQRVGLPILAVALIVAVFAAQKVLSRYEIKPGLWRTLFLVPIIHWFALHRLIPALHNQIADQSGPESDEIRKDAPDTALIIADITVVPAIALWLVPLALMISRGVWPSHPLVNILPVCGTLLLTVSLITELAAMEHTQSRFHKWLNKL